MAEALDTHLSRIYAREVRRVGPEALAIWWDDVDGCGTTIDDWMAQTIAPLLLTLGQLDVCMDHPKAPEGESIETRADVERLGLDRCVAAYILPENMLWWRIDDATHRYLECLVLERHELDDRTVERFRHWTATDSTLYDEEGTLLSKIEHGFGRVPIVRVFDRRKPRANNIGQSRYESVAERQREYYNRDSELILSDSTQAHPLISGPEDYVQSDGTIPIGPGWLLPKLRVANGSSVAYEGFEVIDFPKGASESIRENMKNIRSEVDRDSALVHREGREVRGQSGLSKALDLIDGNNRLAKIARTLARTERILCDLALLVLHDGADPSIQPLEIEIVYPTEFDLYTASDMARTVEEFQSLVRNAGSLPTTEFLMLSRLLRLCLPGMSDRQYAMCDDEIRSHLEGTSESTRTGRDRNSQSNF
ncbi:MAG: hypothetical protein SFX72_19700 [Isosphaeraceae bacterium]|nr:hypothetical protein [Isosphaeraceae bacterium]